MKNLLILLASAIVMMTLSGCGEKTTEEKMSDALESSKEASKSALDDAKKALN